MLCWKCGVMSLPWVCFYRSLKGAGLTFALVCMLFCANAARLMPVNPFSSVSRASTIGSGILFLLQSCCRLNRLSSTLLTTPTLRRRQRPSLNPLEVNEDSAAELHGCSRDKEQRLGAEKKSHASPRFKLCIYFSTRNDKALCFLLL